MIVQGCRSWKVAEISSLAGLDHFLPMGNHLKMITSNMSILIIKRLPKKMYDSLVVVVLLLPSQTTKSYSHPLLDVIIYFIHI